MVNNVVIHKYQFFFFYHKTNFHEKIFHRNGLFLRQLKRELGVVVFQKINKYVTQCVIPKERKNTIYHVENKRRLTGRFYWK